VAKLGVLKRKAFVGAVVAAGLLVSVAACGGGDDDSASSRGSSETTTSAGKGHFGGSTESGNQGAATATDVSYVAKAKGPKVAVYADANATSATQTLDNPYKPGIPLVFLIDGTTTSGDRLPVYLPDKPNGSKGWVNAGDVTIAPDTYKVKIALGAHKITVTNGKDVVVDAPVGLGADGMSTPQGTFFIKELIQPPNPNGDYGPYAYGISAFTDNPAIANQFGGDGQIGMHGTNNPSSIGGNESHGCIRMTNDVITQLAGMLPLGTPVEISA
jgi:lipoprotein-anchoring transpeptidase ErfK/SrfK